MKTKAQLEKSLYCYGEVLPLVVDNFVITRMIIGRRESHPFPDAANAYFDWRKAGFGMSSVRVLVVEDFVAFRQAICSKLGKRGDLQIVCEVSDGLEAVEKAVELKPELIILDIGLPSLNGIEAARQIRTLAPQSKILFLSQERSPRVVEEALNLGALGYVCKTDARRDLLAAVDAVILGKRFVSTFANDDLLSRSNRNPATPYDTVGD